MPKEFFEKLKIASEEEVSKKEREEEKKIQEYFQHLLRPLGEVFCQYGAYGIKIDPKAESFSFDHRSKEVMISTKFIEELELKEAEQRYAFLHELAHLIQLFQNPDAYLKSFEIPAKKAEETGIDERCYRHFFNAFFDIHANSIIRNLMPIYQEGGSEENLPSQLYERKLFPQEEYTELPYSYQFLYYLLRKIMAPESSSEISPEVKKIIDSPISYFGKRYKTLKDFVEGEIFNPSHTINEIMFCLREFLLPIFEKLLEEDKKQGRLKEIPEFLGEFDIDKGIPKDVIEKIAKDYKESKKPPQERYNDHSKEEFKKWAEKKGFLKTEIEKMEEIRKKTRKTVEDLEGLWDKFIQLSVKIHLEKKSGFKRGAGIAPEKVLAELPILLTQPSEAEIFTRYVPEKEKETIKPKRIVLILIPDLSASMHKDKRKIQAVQEVTYSLNKSLINFYRNGKLALAGKGIEFPISIDYRIIAFGSRILELLERTEEEKLKREKKDTPQKDLDEQLWKAVFMIERTNLGGTNDALALGEVEQMLTPEIEGKLKEGDEIWIVIEITDGETATKEKSKALVKELNGKKGIYCRGIQIPGPIYSEVPKEEKKPEERFKPPEVLEPTGTFKEVWGDKWGKRLEDISALKETIVAILYDAIREFKKEKA